MTQDHFKKREITTWSLLYTKNVSNCLRHRLFLCLDNRISLFFVLHTDHGALFARDIRGWTTFLLSVHA